MTGLTKIKLPREGDLSCLQSQTIVCSLRFHSPRQTPLAGRVDSPLLGQAQILVPRA